MKKILFFGDSLTAGFGLINPATEAVPALIQQKINAEHLDYQTVNAGVNGDTTAGGLARIDYWLSQPIAVFVLELGINDVISGGSAAPTIKNMQAIIDKVKAKNPNVRLALMGMEIPVFIPVPFAADFKAIYRQLAEKNNMAFVPFYLDGVAGKIKLNLADRLHPSAEGYRVIADRIWPVIKSCLEVAKPATYAFKNVGVN